MTDEQTATDEISVTRNDAERRYEVFVDGVLAGFTVFIADSSGHEIFPHTEVFPEFGGRGLGGILVGAAMEDEAKRGTTVVPVCPFVVKYLRANDVPGLDIVWRDEEAGV